MAAEVGKLEAQLCAMLFLSGNCNLTIRDFLMKLFEPFAGRAIQFPRLWRKQTSKNPIPPSLSERVSF